MPDGVIVQLRASTSDAIRMAAFVDTVHLVVFGRPQKQMFRIAARRIVARMTDKATFRDRPIRLLIRYSMGFMVSFPGA